MKRNMDITDKISNAIKKNNIFVAEKLIVEALNSDMDDLEKATLKECVTMYYGEMARRN